MTAQQQIASGWSHHQAGRLAEAEKIYREVLAKQPDHVDALHLLGVLVAQVGRPDAAVELIRQSILLKPDFAEAHENLGNALRRLGQLDEAIAAYLRATRLNPNLIISHNNLANALKDKGQLDEAIISYRQVVLLKPDLAEAHCNLGNALQSKRQFEEAIASYEQAIRLKPDLAQAHNNLGNALKNKEQIDEAIASYRKAIRLKPDYIEAHYNLGNALQQKEQLDEAIASLREAVRLKPDLAEAHCNLGNALYSKKQFDEAVASLREAIRFKPDFAEAHAILGNVLKEIGQIDEAIAAYREAVRLKPAYELAHSNLIYALHFHPGYDGRMIYEEHRRWNEQHAEPLKKFIKPHTNSRDPDRPLRIGYVSPDFREHPVGRFLLPLLANHDADRFEIFCYSNVPRSDQMTDLFRRHAKQWRNTVGLADERIAELIREDQIDILVDLTMHAAGNHMLLFARKPAPVQVTYLSYCSTTGLETMDYRLTDPYLDLPGTNDAFYSEKSIRLPETYWCYPLDDQTPDVSPLPALNTGEVTFGCLNNFCKVSSDPFELWIQVLQALPKSRLILHAHEGSHQQRLRDVLEHRDIDPQRLKFVSKVPMPDYFKLYGQIDIGLDPFPCNGGTTTCDALWMGVPVVTLSGQKAIGRGGVSVLRNVGLPELVAETPEQYVQIAMNLAGDLPRLADLRRTLRTRMQGSPLMDAPRFARHVEAAYRQMWRNWCATEGG